MREGVLHQHSEICRAFGFMCWFCLEVELGKKNWLRQWCLDYTHPLLTACPAPGQSCPCLAPHLSCWGCVCRLRAPGALGRHFHFHSKGNAAHSLLLSCTSVKLHSDLLSFTQVQEIDCHQCGLWIPAGAQNWEAVHGF